MSMFGTRYGPVQCPPARSSTFAPTDAYAPLSPMIRACTAVIRPSASQPILYESSIGCRFGWMRKLSGRVSVIFTGRPVSQAISAVCAWIDMSSLPPNAPPFDTSSTSSRSCSTPSTAAHCR